MPLTKSMSRDARFAACSVGGREFYLNARDHADDHAYLDADPQILKSTVYPLNRTLRTTHLEALIRELRQAGLVRLSRSLDGRPILHFPGCEQTRKRSMVSEHVPKADGQPDLLGPAPPLKEKEGRKEPTHSLTSKPSVKGGPGGKPAAAQNAECKMQGWTPFRRCTGGELELLELCQEVLGEQWVANSTFWGNRIMGSDRIKAEPGKVERVMRAVQEAAKGGEIRTTAAQFAMDCWKRFK